MMADQLASAGHIGAELGRLMRDLPPGVVTRVTELQDHSIHVSIDSGEPHVIPPDDRRLCIAEIARKHLKPLVKNVTDWQWNCPEGVLPI